MKNVIIFIVIFIVLILVILGVVMFRGRNVTINDIKSFRYHYTMGYAFNADITYELNCEEECTAYFKPYGEAEEDAKEYKVDKEFVSKLLNILNKYNVGSWDGFNKSDTMVLDGDSFSMSISTSDGKNYSASGYMRWPNNYAAVKEEVGKLFQDLK